MTKLQAPALERNYFFMPFSEFSGSKHRGFASTSIYFEGMVVRSFVFQQRASQRTGQRLPAGVVHAHGVHFNAREGEIDPRKAPQNSLGLS